MTFDWLSFLNRYRIPYVERGPNVARGNVNIRCPMCGDDPSFHLGVSLRGEGWGCWRNKRHRGISPIRLVRALLHCSQREAEQIVGRKASAPIPGDDSFGDRLREVIEGKPDEDIPTLQLLPEMRRLHDSGGGRWFVDYLLSRGYDERAIPWLVKFYDLHYATRGPFAYRLVFPIYMRGRLVNWTGRSIDSRSGLRYRTLSNDATKAFAAGTPQAVLPVNECLFNFDDLVASPGGAAFLVSEGPFDAMRLDFYGRRHPGNIRATAVFGTGNLSEEQVYLLDEVSRKFKRRWLLFDPDAQLTALDRQSRLEYLGFASIRADVISDHDPGAMTVPELARLFGWLDH